MPRPLTNAEMVLLQQETGYLDAGIPVGGSVVMDWSGMYVLVYHSENAGYQTTDVSDLPAATIAELAKWTPSQGVLYFLPQSVQETIQSETETAIDAVKAAGGTVSSIAEAAATTIGQTLNNLLSPVVSALTVPLVLAAVVLVIYFLPQHSR